MHANQVTRRPQDDKKSRLGLDLRLRVDRSKSTQLDVGFSYLGSIFVSKKAAAKGLLAVGFGAEVQ